MWSRIRCIGILYLLGKTEHFCALTQNLCDRAQESTFKHIPNYHVKVWELEIELYFLLPFLIAYIINF